MVLTMEAVAAPLVPTRGPWRWVFNREHRRVTLVGGTPRFDLTVMDFTRWGMQGATPRLLQQSEPGLQLLEPIGTWARPVPGREHHYGWFQRIVHPDAILIQAAPVMLGALLQLRDHPATPLELRPIIIAALDEATGVS